MTTTTEGFVVVSEDQMRSMRNQLRWIKKEANLAYQVLGTNVAQVELGLQRIIEDCNKLEDVMMGLTVSGGKVDPDGLPPLPPLEEEEAIILEAVPSTTPETAFKELAYSELDSVDSLTGVWRIDGLENLEGLTLIRFPGPVVHIREEDGLPVIIYTLTNIPFFEDEFPVIAAWDPIRCTPISFFLFDGNIDPWDYPLMESSWGKIPDQFFMLNYPVEEPAWDGVAEGIMSVLGIEVDETEDADQLREEYARCYIKAAMGEVDGD